MRSPLRGWAATLLLLGGIAGAAAAETGAVGPDPAAEAAGAEVEAESYDPLAGMDSNGRIPRVEKPADLAHPDRWRYIPEGRIKPGNVFQRFLVTSFVVPFVFRDGDVGTGAGIGVTDIDFRQQRRREFAGAFFSYTTKGQQSYWGLWRRWLHTIDVPEGGVLQEERSYVGLTGGYQKTLTRRFFGFGANSHEDDQVQYVDEVYEIELAASLAVPDPGANLVVSGGVRAEIHALSSDCDEILMGAEKRALCPTGDFDAKEAFEQLIHDDDHEQTGWLLAGARWDTRDSTVNPYGGWYVGLTLSAPLLQDEGDVGVLYELDAGKVFRMPPLFHDGGDAGEENPPTDTLAFGFQTRFKSGDLPFTALPTLGGSRTLRGFIDGRFRDDASVHAGVEHRIWVIPRGFGITKSIRVERVGIAPFFEVGTVAHDGFDLFGRQLRTSYGVGLRALLERSAPFRLDVGFSKDGYNISARFGYTF